MIKRFAVLLVTLMLLCGCACADDNVWALCKSYVNLRAKPSTKAEIVGYLDCGDGAETDCVVKNGWLHIVRPSMESGDSWVNLSYMVYSKPEKVDALMSVVGNGRVALRKTVDGKRRAWIRQGDMLKVLWVSDEWSLTNRGYIRTEYLKGGE